MMEIQQRTSLRLPRRRWLVPPVIIVALMLFSSVAWAHNTQFNDTRIDTADDGSVGAIIEAKSTGGDLSPGQDFNLVFANTTREECHHGEVIGGPKSVNAKGNIAKTGGNVPLRSPGTYEVCFNSTDNQINTSPDFFTVTKASTLIFSESEVPNNWEIRGTISGSDFKPGLTYDVRWNVPAADPPFEYSVATVTADSSGAFNATINIDNTGSPPGGSSSVSAYVHVYNDANKCIATAGVLITMSASGSPVEEVLPAKTLADGVIVRAGEQSATNVHNGYGRVHVDTARADLGGWTGTRDQTTKALATPDAGYPQVDGTSLKFRRKDWVVIVEIGTKDSVDGKMRGLITTRPVSARDA